MTGEEQLKELFEAIAFDLQEAIKDKLIELDIRFTGAGVSSVRVIFDGKNFQISMADYLEFIEYGMPNPTSPEELEDWVSKKMLKNYHGKNKDRAVKRVSEHVAEKITKFGPRPNPFLRPTLHTKLPLIIEENIRLFSA